MKITGAKGPLGVPPIRISNGIYAYQREDGAWIYARRPRQPYKNDDNAQFNRDQLRVSAWLAKGSIPVEQEAARNFAVNSNDTYKDILTRAQFGTLFRVILKDGTEYHPADHSFEAPPEELPGMAGFTVIQTTNFVTGVGQASVQCILPANIDELLIIYRGIGAAINSQRCVQFSTNGGTSYHTTLGDYNILVAGGTITNTVAFVASGANNNVQQTGFHYFPNMTPGAGPIINTNPGYSGLSGLFFGSVNPVNAVRFLNLPATNLTGTTGTSYIVFLGR